MLRSSIILIEHHDIHTILYTNQERPQKITSLSEKYFKCKYKVYTMSFLELIFTILTVIVEIHLQKRNIYILLFIKNLIIKNIFFCGAFSLSPLRAPLIPTDSSLIVTQLRTKIRYLCHINKYILLNKTMYAVRVQIESK